MPRAPNARVLFGAFVLITILVAGCGGGDSDEPTEPANVGDPVTISGPENGQELSATVTDVAEARRLVGVKLTIENGGDTVYDDLPSNFADLVLSTDEQVDSTFPVPGCKDPGSVRLSPGATRKLCIPYEVSSGDPVLFQFQPGIGWGTGEWKLP